jgi:hypothetical protein
MWCAWLWQWTGFGSLLVYLSLGGVFQSLVLTEEVLAVSVQSRGKEDEGLKG